MTEAERELIKALQEAIEIGTYLAYPDNLNEEDYKRERGNLDRLHEYLSPLSLKLIEQEMRERGEFVAEDES